MPKLGELGDAIVGRTAEGRPIIRNPDGSHSTERSITGPWGPKGEWVNIPSMFGGKQVSEEEAVRIMRSNDFVDPETGRQMPFFPDQDSAVTAAQQRTTGELGQYGGAGAMPGPYDARDVAVGNDRLPLLQLIDQSLRRLPPGGAPAAPAQMMQGFGQPQPMQPLGQLSPFLMSRMALEQPEMAAKVAASTGQPPPAAASAATPAVGQSAVDPNALGLALAGVQGMEGQRQGAPPPISPQQFGGQLGSGAQNLMQLMGRQSPMVPSLGAILGG